MEMAGEDFNEALVDIVARNAFYNSCPISEDPAVLEAMRKVDRRKFLPEKVYVQIDSLEEEVKLLFLRDLGLLLADFGGVENVVRYFQLLSSCPNEAPPESFFSQVKISLGNVLNLLLSGMSLPETATALAVETRGMAYNNIALSIGQGQTCSMPSMVAFMTRALELQQGMNVLEIGTGCLYHAAIVEKLVGDKGRVYSVESVPQLFALANGNNRAHCGGRICIVQGDGSVGLLQYAPFNRIYLAAGVESSKDVLLGETPPGKAGGFDPQVLGNQLKPGGILLFPEASGRMIRYKRDETGELIGPQVLAERVTFVPLTGKNS